MKRCGKCGVEKPLDEFHRSRRDGRQLWCKTCRREYDAEYYASRRDELNERKRVRRREMRAWYKTLKKDKPCADCGGVFHPDAMAWDHRPRTGKRTEVSLMVRGFSQKAILDEIAKCDLVCANCHAGRTSNRRQRDVAQPG